MPPERRAFWTRWRGIGRWWFSLFLAGAWVMSRILANWFAGLLLGDPIPLTYGKMLWSALSGFGFGLLIWYYNERSFAAAQSADTRKSDDNPATSGA
jgi:hypothetical protein